ncbi:MAG: hypothetical protein ACPG8W_17315 [Candidatus Promineifilaceae bacterium]
MNLKQLRLSTRELVFMLIALGSLAFAWMGTASANEPNPTEESALVEFEDEFDEDGEWIDIEDEDMMLDAVAKAIGIDIDTLFTEMDNGKSIADIATANEVDPQTIVDLLIAEENAFVDELLAEGEITEEEANEWKAESAKYTEFDVYAAYPNPEVIAAGVIGIDAEALRTEMYDNGSTIKAIAEANNVDPQAVIDAIVSAENTSIDEMVAAGLVSEEEAAEWKAETAEFATAMVNDSFEDVDCDEVMHDEFEMFEDADAEGEEAPQTEGEDA